MKRLLKILLLAGIVVFSLVNLRFYTFQKGFSVTKTKENQSLTKTLSLLTDIEKVEYYKSSFEDGNYNFRVYIKTGGDCYLLKATQDDIDAFSTLGIFSKKLKPKKISPIPIYVDIIVFIIVLFIPVKKKNKSKKKSLKLTFD